MQEIKWFSETWNKVSHHILGTTKLKKLVKLPNFLQVKN